MSIAVFHGDKGGVGKSTIAAAYTEFLASQNREFIAIDCDMRNGDFSRYTKTFAKEVVRIDLRGDGDDFDAGWLQVYKILTESKVADIVISLPGAIGGVIVDHGAELLEVAADTGRSARYFWVLDSSTDSIALLSPLAEVVGWSNITVIKNRRFGSDSKFAVWIAGKTRLKLLDGGGHEVEFPRLGDGLIAATFRANPPLRFTVKEHLHYGQRLMLKTWVKGAYATFSGAAK